MACGATRTAVRVVGCLVVPGARGEPWTGREHARVRWRCGVVRLWSVASDAAGCAQRTRRGPRRSFASRSRGKVAEFWHGGVPRWHAVPFWQREAGAKVARLRGFCEGAKLARRLQVAGLATRAGRQYATVRALTSGVAMTTKPVSSGCDAASAPKVPTQGKQGRWLNSNTKKVHLIPVKSIKGGLSVHPTMDAAEDGVPFVWKGRLGQRSWGVTHNNTGGRVVGPYATMREAMAARELLLKEWSGWERAMVAEDVTRDGKDAWLKVRETMGVRS